MLIFTKRPGLRPRPAPERTKELNPSRGAKDWALPEGGTGFGGEDWPRYMHLICIQRPIASARPRAENPRAKGVSSDVTSLLDDSKVRQALEDRMSAERGGERPMEGGGYAGPTGPDGARSGHLSRRALQLELSESWLAVKPGTEDLVGASSSSSRSSRLSSGGRGDA